MSSNPETTVGTPEARERKEYFALLACVMALTVIGPLVEHHLIGRLLVGVLSFAALAAATLVTKVSRRTSTVAVVLACLTSLLWIVSLFAPAVSVFTIHTQGVAYLLTLCFATTIIFIMTKDIFTNAVTGNRVAGAICVYVMLGFTFAIIHMLIFLYNVDSYKDSGGDRLTDHRGVELSTQHVYPVFVYYSFCTLSTVGYGDIVPVSRIARSMSWLEAIGGQIYLTVLVARLVGLHIAAKDNVGAESNGTAKIEPGDGKPNVS